MKYFSMFSGIGGFELGIKKAFIKSYKRQHQTKNTRCENSMDIRQEWQQASNIGFSEIDKYAIQIYKKHFPKHKNFEDATKIIPERLPDFDLLCGGFPCQSFSIIGKRKGFEDTRGTLFFEICRIARAKRPSYIFLENVRGLLSHDNGYTFLVILESLAELGYILQWQVLNSKDFGVPQNRERVFIIGHLTKASPPKVFPIRKVSKKTLTQVGQLEGKMESTNRIYNTDLACCLTGDGGGLSDKTELYNISPTIRAEHHNTADVHYIPENSGIRRLTPTECERLQGFPDGWTEGISDTQRYKCLGNAVTVNVIKAIMLRWLKHVQMELF